MGVWADGWTLDNRSPRHCFYEGWRFATLMLRTLTSLSREPVSYDELLLPLEAPGNRDRRGDLSECEKRR